jgi:ribosome-binding ATPase YchF (GTP1/OBG family)
MNTTSALDKIIVQGYKALQLEYFFTAGPDEVKAWTIQVGVLCIQGSGSEFCPRPSSLFIPALKS